MTNTRRKIKQDQLLLIAGDGLSLNGQDRLQFGDDTSIFFTPKNGTDDDAIVTIQGNIISNYDLNNITSSFNVGNGFLGPEIFHQSVRGDFQTLIHQYISSNRIDLVLQSEWQSPIDSDYFFSKLTQRVEDDENRISLNANGNVSGVSGQLDLTLKYTTFNGWESIFTDTAAEKGIVYAADYSTNGVLDDRWIPDFGAVKAEISTELSALTTDDITEGANLYYTEARVQSFSDPRYVNIDGDTMTGSLLITAPARIDSVTTGGTDVLNIGTQNAGVINIGWEGAVINFEGTQHNMEGTNTYFTDKLVTYNAGGPIASAVSTGFEIEEDAVITGYFKTNGTRDGWLLKAPANEELELDTAGITTSRNQSFQDLSGTIALVGVGLTDTRYATTSHAVTHISGGSDQIDGEDLKVEVVPPTTNYAPTESTLRGHFQGIDSTLGTLRTTTAGLLARVFFTGEEHVVDSVTYFRSKLGDFGSVANASPTPLSLTQASGETFFNQDLLSDPFAADLFVPAGAFSGTLTVRVNSAGHQERYRVEIYLADGTTGAVVDSGVSGAPVGDLGVPVIAAFSTGVIELPNGVLTNASIDGTLLESINIPTGARVRTHISAQKLTSGGGSMTFEVFYGSDNRSQYDIPVAPTTDTVINRSDVTGQTSGEALDFLLNNKENLSNKATNFTTLNNTLYPTTQAVVNKFVTLDTIQSISSIKTFGANTLRIESSGGGANQELRFRNITATSAGNTGVTTMGINGNNDLFIHKGSTGNEGILAFNNTSLRTYTLQDKSGTVAHLDDITSAVNGTNNTIPKFTGANTIGDSQITDDGTTLGLTTNWSILSSGILQSNGAQTIQTSGTEALTLQGNGGNVGIGASAIGQTAGLGTTLTVKGTIPGIEIIGNRASNGIVSTIPFLNDSSTDTTFQKRIVQISAFRDISNERGVLTFQNHNGTSLLETARITSNGNFLIGTTTDTGEKLQVNGNLKASGSKVNFANLPTSDPAVAGDLWNDSGTVKISAG